MAKTITMNGVRGRSVTVHGRVHEGSFDPLANVVIEPGVSIRLHGRDNNRYALDANHKPVKGPDGRFLVGVDYDVTYKIGDVAEYDSFNLSYYGRITSITAKTVSIEDHGKTRRLDIAEFTRRNRTFNHDRAAQENSNTLVTL